MTTDNICQRNCHECKLQENIYDKVTCAMLLMPAMLKELSEQASELKSILIQNNKSANVKEVYLNKSESDENVEDDDE